MRSCRTGFRFDRRSDGVIGLVVPVGRWPLEPEAIDALRDTARTFPASLARRCGRRAATDRKEDI